MKLKLNNFRCYEGEREFDLGSSGLVLLSGTSGQGKTTIMMAIQFVLFGVGTKLPTYGKTSCSVELEYEDLYIIRTKRPNRLTLNGIYEDQAAQDIINERFGSTFDVTGYVSQNATNSFILMSPLEKLSFLEKFAFNNVDLRRLKEKCKAVITQRNEHMIGLIAKLELAREMLAVIKRPDTIEFPIKCKKSQREIAIKNENTRLKNCTIIIKRYLYSIKDLETKLGDTRVLFASLEANNERLKELFDIKRDLENKRLGYCDENSTCDIITDEQVAMYRKRISFIKSRSELTDLESRYKSDCDTLSDMKEDEKANWNEEITKIEDKLWKEHSKEDIKELTEEHQQIIEDAKEYNRLFVEKTKLEKSMEQIKKSIIISDEDYQDKEDGEDISDIVKFIQRKIDKISCEISSKKQLYDRLLLERELYTCPSCESKLRLVSNNLVLEKGFEEEKKNESDNSISLQEIKKNISELTSEKSRYEKYLLETNTCLINQTKIDKQINEIIDCYESKDDIPTIDIDIPSSKKYIEDLSAYFTRQTENEKRLNMLKTKQIYSASTISFEKSVNKLKTRIDEINNTYKLSQLSFDSNNEEDITEKTLEILEYELSSALEHRREFLEIERDLKETAASITKYSNINSKLREQFTTKYEITNDHIESENDIKEEISRIKSLITEQETRKTGHEEMIKKIQEWNEYVALCEKYDEQYKKVKEIEEQELLSRKMYSAAMTLKNKILEAESIAIMNVIDSINTHAQAYLDCFFPDNPISVRLQPFKETKKATKPTINIEIEYKGMECDINSLSGGELSRVILSYTLALAEMFNTPILLLDECTANLDQELTSIVFSGIKEMFNGKLTVIIAHQIITGTFDSVISI